MRNDASSQRSYILRLWVEVLEGKHVWRFSLEDTHTGKRKGFARVEDLFAFVQMQLREGEDD